MQNQTFSPFAEHIWDLKYRLRDAGGTPVDVTLADTWSRVARAASEAERPAARKRWASRFEEAMSGFEFLPAGRILAGAGSGRQVTLFNCFVLGTIQDDMSSIFENVREAALTMQQGGGIGHDFSTLRPRGAPVHGVGADASGPVSFMDVWDAMCRTIMSAGQRRGAMMGTMRCDHPDIEEFISAKADAKRLRNFNLSVLVTDPFIAAVKAGQDWPLSFAGQVYRTVKARNLWSAIMRATYDYAEPGVIFIDRINARNNLSYCETISATNPCGEQPLPPYGACLLGSINLVRLIKAPFTPEAELDTARLEELTTVAVRFLDNVIEVSGYPLEKQKQEAFAKRRLGLGITGLADALIMCGLNYADEDARAKAGQWMSMIQAAAYRASADLAAERGPFPLFEAKALLARPGLALLSEPLRRDIAKTGLRNGLLTSIAPTGTISLLAGNVSSGIEPVFGFTFQRRVLGQNGQTRQMDVEDYAHDLFRRLEGNAVPLTPAFVTADDLKPIHHLKMQAALQPHVDSSISKTINCPEAIGFEAFGDIYLQAYDLGLKGCTTFRPNAVTGSVLTATAPQSGSASPPAIGQPAIGPPAVGQPGNATQSQQALLPLPAPLPRPNAAQHAVIENAGAPAARDAVLPGFTYKLRWPDSDHAIYVTINDVVEAGGQRRPFEIFINSKNLEHYAWTVALTRMISAVFRRGGDVGFVVEELKAVFDPRGGQWMNGRYVPSLLAAIGGIIEQHMIATGFLPRPASLTPQQGPWPDADRPVMANADVANADLAAVRSGSGCGTSDDRWPPHLAGAGDRPAFHEPSRTWTPPPTENQHSGAGAGLSSPGGRLCPNCQQPAFIAMEGCWVCRVCGYSKCA